MIARHIVARHLASAALVVVIVGGTASLSPVAAAEASTYHECYRSIRECQKSRCGKDSGSEQVDCIRQCNREYETCVGGAGGAGSAGSILNIPDKLTTPTTKQRKRDVRRQQTP